MSEAKHDEPDVRKIVVAVDVCSSSSIMDDLLKNGRTWKWRDLIIHMDRYLKAKSNDLNAQVQKFVGDGWIMFFNSYDGGKIIQLLSDVLDEFLRLYRGDIFPSLDTPPEIFGLTFGIDEGRIIKLTMDQGDVEFVGRPINIACRLQAKLDKNDIADGFRILMSHRLFNDCD